MKFPDRNLQLLVLAISALWIFSIGVFKASHYSIDFTPVYTGARCLIAGCNPYDTAQLDKQYFESGGPVSQPPRWEGDPPVYPPSTFLVLTPLVLLKLPAARIIWALMNSLLLVLCVVLVWLEMPVFSRWLPTILGSILLVETGRKLIPQGQPAAFAIPLLVVSTLLYLRGRYIPLATISLMLSLAVKPQMGGLIALYFVFRKIHWRAVAFAMGGALAMVLIAGLALRASPASRHWVADLRTNLVNAEKPGGINDPRPSNLKNLNNTDLTNAQVITSVFVVNEQRYNAAAYGIFAALLLAWIIAVARNDEYLPNHYLAVAALTVISFLPIYHRDYDTVLLILTVPAIAIIYYQRRQWFGPIVVVAAVLQSLSLFLHGPARVQNLVRHKLLFILLMPQQALVMMFLAILYIVAMFAVRPPAGWMLEDLGISNGENKSVVASVR
jgi:hypothetical protein